MFRNTNPHRVYYPPIDSQPDSPPACTALSLAVRSVERPRLAPRRLFSSAPDHGPPFRLLTPSTRGLRLATTFRSPGMTARFQATTPRSKFPAYCFLAPFDCSEARSADCSPTHDGLLPPWSGSLLPARCLFPNQTFPIAP
jgi:hypothetical protein